VSGAKEPLVLTGEALCGTADARVTYGYEGESFHFLDCVAKGCETAVSFADALKSQELAERIEKGSQHFV
jgi:predicted dehydrogenase